MSAVTKRRPALSLAANEPRSIALAAIGLAGATALGLGAAARSLDGARALDSVMRAALAAMPVPFQLEIANAMTWISDPAVSAATVALLGIALYRREGRFALVAPAFLAVTFLIELSFKSLLADQPPSYPSGHVARIVFLSIVAGVLPGALAIRLAFALVAALTILTRVSIGVHPLTDVVGGLGLGAATGSAAVLCLHARSRERPAPKAMSVREPGRSAS